MASVRSEDFSVQERFTHPHLAGLHTVQQLDDGRTLASCSASDAVLVCDLNEGSAQCFRMPANLYGQNYSLTPEKDLRRHYIPDEYQTTHINAASADQTGRRVVVSTLIQGAIGIFDVQSGEYAEVSRGHVGCHGARFDCSGRIYFADSTRGGLVFLNERGAEDRRVEVGSFWLHDVCQLYGAVYAFSLADLNELRICDIDREELLFQRRFPTIPIADSAPVPAGPAEWLGNSTQALSYTALADAGR